MPDMDIDFADDRRDEVIRYVADRYGRDRVAHIITFGTLGAKAAIRDVGRVLGMTYTDVDRIAKLVPAFPLNISLEEAAQRVASSRRDDPHAAEREGALGHRPRPGRLHAARLRARLGRGDLR